MAPKRPSPLDEPPPASSSEDEETTSEGDEKEEASGFESGSEEEEDGEAEINAKSSALPSNHAAENNKAPPKKDESESETESDSGSDPEPDNPRRPNADPNVGPIASKPIEETPGSKSGATPVARLTAKRAGGESAAAKDSKRARKNGPESKDDDDGNGGEASTTAGDLKKLFQRLWSEDDEIVILKGMIDYATKTGTDPFADMNGFHDFIKKSLQVDVAKNKLVEKARRLKKKYLNRAGKGDKYNPTKPHEVEAFELSKKIWGDGEAIFPKSNGKVKNTNKKSNGSPKAEKMEFEEEEEEEEEADGVSEVLSESLKEVVEGVGVPEHAVKRGFELLPRSKKAELKEKWKKLRMAELELYAMRTQLVSEQVNLIFDAYRNSSNC